MSVDWTAVSAIATIMMTIATFLAVVVALWTTVTARKPKVKLSFSPYGFLGVQGIGITEEYIILTVTNTGTRPVNINEWGLLLSKQGKRAVITEVVSTPDIPCLPVQLDVDDSLWLKVEQHRFCKEIRPLVKQRELLASDKLRFYVVYGVGRLARINTRYTVDEILSMINRLGMTG